MLTRFRSRRRLREYVEAELDRVVAKHPELKVTFKAGSTHGRPSSDLWWQITDTAASKWSFYTLEVRRDLREILVWYGHSSAGPMNPRHFMRQAVHLDFDELRRNQPESWRRSAGGLADVMDIMVANREASCGITYPMNCPTLT